MTTDSCDAGLARLDDIFDLAGDAIIIIDQQQRILRFNRSAEEIFGWQAAEVLNQPLSMLMPARFEKLHPTLVNHFGSGGKPSRRMGERSTVTGQRKDGQEFPCEVSISRLEQDGQITYTAILRDITERVQARQLLEQRVEERTRQIEAQRQRAEKLAQENAELARQADALAVERERNRLGRELHDSVAQMIYSLTLLAEAGRRQAAASDLAQAQATLARLAEVSHQSLKEMRLLVFELRPPVLEQEGLLGALQQRVDAVEGRAGVVARLRVEGSLDLPPEVQDGLYRIALEALNNSLKHSGATQVELHLHAQKGSVELEISDNGRGFDPPAGEHSGGMGLRSMQERAVQLGGSCLVTSVPGSGTQVRVRLPAAACG